MMSCQKEIKTPDLVPVPNAGWVVPELAGAKRGGDQRMVAAERVAAVVSGKGGPGMLLWNKLRVLLEASRIIGYGT